MSSWSMNDGSALTGTYTFTNGSAVVQGNSSADTSEIKVGDIVIDDNGDKVRVSALEATRTVATSAVNASNEQVTITNHGFVANQVVKYSNGGGTTMAGLTDDTDFFIKSVASADAFTLSATAGGAEIDITGTGNNAQTFSGASTKAFTATEAFSPSTNSGSACTVTRPPINFASAAPHIDANILGVTATESLAGVDNVSSAAVSSDGSGYGSAPSVTIAAPTARTITQANIDETTNVFTVTGHNMRDGTKLTYTSNGTNIVHSGGTLADSTAVFVRDATTNTFKIALTAGGTALDITNDGNDSNSFVGDTATATATVSGGVVTGVTVTAVGSDYQSAPAVTVAAPSEVTFNAQSAVSTANDTITASSHPFNTGDSVTYADKGGTVLANLTDGGTFFIIKVDANTVKLATTLDNANDGTAIDLTAGSSENHGLTGATATAVATLGLGLTGADEGTEVAHIGWVKRTVGTGGRAGRVHYETLVAASSISGDASDDIALSDS